MFDAYTVKKVLPRIVIAVILIQLSWFLFSGMIFLTNSIAYGIEGLIYAPFGGPEEFTLDVLLSSLDSSATTVFTTAAIGVAAVTFAGGVFAVVGFIVIAILVAFLTLAIRRMLLIMLLLLAPLALVAWILPNTEKFWKMWWDNFTKLLLMYPLILAFIAAGRVFAKIAGEIGGSDMINTVIIIGGYFIPLMLIPKTFSMAGSAFATIGGAVAQRGAGAQNWARGMGQNRQKQKWAKRNQDFKTGNLAKNPRTFAGRSINRLGTRVGAEGGFSMRKARRNAAMDSAAAVNSEKIKGTDAWKGIMFDDDAMRALTYSNKAEAHAALMAENGGDKAAADAAVAKASLVGFGEHNKVAAVQQMVANKTGFKNALDAMDTISRVSGSNESLRTSLREQVKFTGKQVGRSDLGGLSDIQAGESRDQYRRRMTIAGAATADTYTLGKNHDIGLKNIARDTAEELDETRAQHAAAVAAGDTATAARLEQQAGELWGTAKDILDAKAYTSGSGADVIEGFEQMSSQTGEYLGNIVDPSSPVGPPPPVAVRDPANPNNWIYVPGQQQVVSVRQQAEADHARRETIDPRDPRLNP